MASAHELLKLRSESAVEEILSAALAAVPHLETL